MNQSFIFIALLPDLVLSRLVFLLGQHLALGPDLVDGATALVAVAMKGKSSHYSSCA